MDQGIVLFSGGQDSTTCLLLAIERYGKDNVHPISFSYRQKHEIELRQAHLICNALDVRKPVVLNVDVLRALGGGALTNDEIRVSANAAGSGNDYAEKHGLPPTVVPGRNMLFLTLAAAYGAKIGVYDLWTGGCLADYEGYPDCRPEFYGAAQLALREALDDDSLSIVTPLISVSKADTFAIARDLGHLDLIRQLTHTCYNGIRVAHEWGAGCGYCPACQTRAAGWQEFMASPGPVMEGR
jgi:7-cyano-7-deazaguanine synthase